MIQKREIALSIILSIITCGFYSIYWYIVLVDDVNKISKKNNMSGGLSFVIGLITCGLFILYTFYRMGDDLDNYFVNKGNAPGNKGILYLIISFFGLSIISMALIQNDLNNIREDFAPANVVDVAYTQTSSSQGTSSQESSGVNLNK